MCVYRPGWVGEKRLQCNEGDELTEEQWQCKKAVFYALFMGHDLLHLICHSHACAPNPCIEPTKNEHAISEITNPQSYYGEEVTELRALWNTLHPSAHAALLKTTLQVSLWCRFRFRLHSLALAVHSYSLYHPAHSSLLPPPIRVYTFLPRRVPPSAGGTAESLLPTRVHPRRKYSVFDVF